MIGAVAGQEHGLATSQQSPGEVNRPVGGRHVDGRLHVVVEELVEAAAADDCDRRRVSDWYAHWSRLSPAAVRAHYTTSYDPMTEVPPGSPCIEAGGSVASSGRRLR